MSYSYPRPHSSYMPRMYDELNPRSRVFQLHEEQYFLFTVMLFVLKKINYKEHKGSLYKGRRGNFAQRARRRDAKDFLPL